MADKKLRYDLSIETRDAVRGLDNTATAAKGVADQLDDTRSRGGVLADAMKGHASDVRSELRETELAADALGTALGPELAAKVNTRELVAEFRNAGLTLDDVTVDAEELADAIRALDDVAVDLDQVRAAGDDLGRVRTQAASVGDDVERGMGRAGDASRNFSAGMVGDMAGAASGIGPLSEGVAQLSEGLLEGSVNFKSLLKGGLAMGAVALVTSKIAGDLQRAAEIKAFRREQVDSYGDALREVDDTLGAIVKKLTDDREVKVLTFDGIKDILPILDEAGVSMDQWTTAISGNVAAQDELKALLAESTLSDEERIAVLFGMATELDNVTKATGRAAQEQRFFSAESNKAEQQIEHMGEAARNGTEPARKYNEEIRHMGEAARDGQEPARKLGEVTVGVGSAMERAERAARDYDDAISALLGNLDKEEALIRLGNQFDELKVAEDEAAAAVANHGAESEEAAESAEKLRLKQIDVTRDMITYATEVLKLPEHRITEFQAMIDAGSAAEVQAEIDRIAASRKVWMQLVLDVNAAKKAAMATNVHGATGGIVTRPTVALIGEAGPEAVIPLNRTPGSSRLPAGLGAPQHVTNNYTNITNHIPPGGARQWGIDRREAQRRRLPGWKS